MIATLLVSASAFGKESVDRLSEETVALLNLQEGEESRGKPAQQPADRRRGDDGQQVQGDGAGVPTVERWLNRKKET